MIRHGIGRLGATGPFTWVPKENKVSSTTFKLLAVDTAPRIYNERFGHKTDPKQFVMSMPSSEPVYEVPVREHFLMVSLPTFDHCWTHKCFNECQPILVCLPEIILCQRILWQEGGLIYGGLSSTVAKGYLPKLHIVI